MKKFSILLALIGLVSSTMAQRGPLNGNGVVIRKTFDFRNFDKLKLQDLAGEVSVVVGKPFGIEVEIDENLAPLLNVALLDEGKLLVELARNRNNVLYVEKTNIKVQISLPEISVLEHRSNSDLRVRGIVGRYFRLANTGNGDASVAGTIDTFDLVKEGNGDVDAAGLGAKKIEVRAYGNGNVKVNALQQLSVSGSGNGNVQQVGTGALDKDAQLGGNGRIILRN